MISACYAATYLGITSPDLRGSQHLPIFTPWARTSTR